MIAMYVRHAKHLELPVAMLINCIFDYRDTPDFFASPTSKTRGLEERRRWTGQTGSTTAAYALGHSRAQLSVRVGELGWV
jgi:hypothetical protein